MRKRVHASKPQSRSHNSGNDSSSLKSSNESVEPLLHHIMYDCYMDDISPSQCIPLYLIRNKSIPAVKKLVSLFQGKLASSNSISGMVSGSPTSIVVPLVKDLEHMVDEYFISEGYSDLDAKELKSKQKNWFGVIDGCQFYNAVTSLIKIDPDRWSQFRWKLIVVQPGRSLTEYRQLARVQNEKNKALFIHETTIYDLINGLRKEYDELSRIALKNSRTGARGAKVNYKHVAERYDGGDHSKNTYIRQVVTVAARLHLRTIDTIGKVVNEDCAEIVLCDKELNRSDMKTVEDVYCQKDSRLFKSFVSFGSLRGSKAFMNAVLDDQVEAQVNTIFRLRHWSEMNRFKSAQHTVITEQFNMSILSLKEEQKFLSLIKENEWPAHMENTRTNLLHTTLCDSELQMNSGNDKDILPSLWRNFKRLYPTKARNIEENEETESKDEDDCPKLPEEEIPEALECDLNENRKEESQKRKKEEILKRKRDEIIQKWDKKRLSADEHLKECGIYSYQMSFGDYSKQIYSTSSPKVDLVISAIPMDLSEDELKSLPTFC